MTFKFYTYFSGEGNGLALSMACSVSFRIKLEEEAGTLLASLYETNCDEDGVRVLDP